jgi:peptidoglycan/LPS O-acetylase OafA/YrhL
LDSMRVFPLGLALSFAAALISYWCLEKPLLRLKDRKFHKTAVALEAQPAPAVLEN